MHGNVWEWCEDVWHDNYNGAPTNSNAWLNGGVSSLRVLRSGSWLDFDRDCRSASRTNAGADQSYFNRGMRIVLTVRTR